MCFFFILSTRNQSITKISFRCDSAVGIVGMVNAINQPVSTAVYVGDVITCSSRGGVTVECRLQVFINRLSRWALQNILCSYGKAYDTVASPVLRRGISPKTPQELQADHRGLSTDECMLSPGGWVSWHLADACFVLHSAYPERTAVCRIWTFFEGSTECAFTYGGRVFSHRLHYFNRT